MNFLNESAGKSENLLLLEPIAYNAGIPTAGIIIMIQSTKCWKN